MTPARARTTAVALGALVALTACGKREAPVNPEDRLCGGGNGVGLEVVGRAEPVEVCVPDDDLEVAFTSEYVVTARMTTNKEVIEFQMTFRHNPNFPVTLFPTEDFSVYSVDPNAVWMFYQEIPNQGEPLESAEITSGTMTLSFSDGAVAAGVVTGIKMNLINKNNMDPAGSREITEGFFSISVDS